MSGEPKTARGKAIVEAAREMADAAERAATAYEQGCVLTRSGAEDEAATARAEIDRLVADFEDALSVSEERARMAEAERDEWRAFVQARNSYQSQLETLSRERERDVEELREALTQAVTAKNAKERAAARKRANEALVATVSCPFLRRTYPARCAPRIAAYARAKPRLRTYQIGTPSC